VRLAILNLVSVGMSRGYRKYLQKLLPRIREDRRIEAIRVFTPEAISALPEFADLDMESYPAAWSLAGSDQLMNSLRRFRLDVLFIPTARWINPGIAGATVVMVRNMEPLLGSAIRNPLGERVKNLLRTYVARSACQRADRVIAVSQYVRNFISDRWSLPESKIGVVYHGVDLPDPQRELKRPEAATAMQPDRFLFVAGSIRPARGLEDLVAAFSHGGVRSDLRVLVAGTVDPGMNSYRTYLDRLISEHDLKGRFLWAGELNGPEMSWCYRNCLCFIMTSRAEACPNTVLEALAHGCVSISTSTPPMPEFFADEAFYYDQGDALTLAATISKVGGLSAVECNQRREAARARATAFNWETTAKKTVDDLLGIRNAKDRVSS